jgi:hypothetical protein
MLGARWFEIPYILIINETRGQLKRGGLSEFVVRTLKVAHRNKLASHYIRYVASRSEQASLILSNNDRANGRP